MTRMFKDLFSRLSGSNNRLLVILCLIFIIATQSGCSAYDFNANKEDKQEIKIGVCIHNGYEQFVWKIGNEMTEWCKAKEEETGIKISMDIVSSKGSQLTQNEQVEKFITQNVDILCVNLVDRTDPTVIIDSAMEADIPVIFFNRELVREDLNRWDKLYYVGAVAQQAGRLQAEIIINALSDSQKFDAVDVNHNGTIQYVILEGEPGHQDALIRTSICTELLQNAGLSIEKLADENANWDRDQAKTKMKAMINKYPFQIEMVIANDDEMALGAIDALEESNYPIKPLVVGVNGCEEALEAISTGKMEGSVYNDARGKADAIMTLAYSIALDEKLPESLHLNFGKYIYLPYRSITAGNVYKYRDINK